MALACAGATAAGVPGRFRAWEHNGLLAVSATDPALGFLSTVSGVTEENVSAVAELVHGWEPTVLVSSVLDLEVAGLARLADRMLAVRGLDDVPAPAGELEVVEGGDGFVRVLLAGYEVDGVVGAFVAAEHGMPGVRRFVAVDGDGPVAAAAMTIHGDVAVIGGASTLRAHRGRGAQTLLLRHRLRTAADAGCTLAVATARPGSASAGNLRRAGFEIRARSAWAVSRAAAVRDRRGGTT